MNRPRGRAHDPGPPAELEDAFTRGGIANRRQLAIGLLLAVLLLVTVAGALAWNQYQSAQRTALRSERARAVVAGSVVDTYFRGELVGPAGDRRCAVGRQPRRPGHEAVLRATPAGRWPRIQRRARLGGQRGHRRVPKPANGRLDVSDRSYFWNVVNTGRPYVSEGINSRVDGARVIVMAVPTMDGRGRMTGVLTAALLNRPFAITKGSLDLGGPAVVVLDRNGRSLLSGGGDPTNASLVSSLHGTGVIADTHGLDGSDDHAVAYTVSSIPGWTIVIDQPRSVLFADARRGLFLELALVTAAASIVLFLIGFILMRGRRAAERERTRARQRRDLSRILGSASLGTEVSDALVTGLADAFPGALCVVALDAADHHGLELSAAAEGAFPTTADALDLVVSQAATLAFESGSAIVIGKEPDLQATLPGVHQALLGAAHSFYATPLVNRGGNRLGALCLLFAHAHPLNESEQAQVAWYAEQAAQAFDRATAFEREHEVAVRAAAQPALEPPARDRRASSWSGATRRAARGSRSAATGTTRSAAPTASCT